MKKIIVLCTGNSCRSQMAEGYLKKYLRNKAEIFSAGTKNHHINQKAVEIMMDDGIDISSQTSNNVLEYSNINFDYVITVCDHANETCPTIFAKKAVRIHHNFFDPSSILDKNIIDISFKKCREEIKKFCLNFSEKYFN